MIHYCKASPAHFDADEASNSLERTDYSVGGELLSNESLGKPPPKGRTRFLTKSWIGASRLAASSAPEARAALCLRRLCAKAAKPPPAISAHLPVESLVGSCWWLSRHPFLMSAVRIMRVCEDYRLAITDFAFEIQESFCLLASRLISFSLTRFNSY